MTMVLGLDAGGTRVTALAADGGGSVLGEGHGGPANPRAVPWETAVASLRTAAGQALGAAGLASQPDVAVVGMAGATTPAIQATYAAQLEEAGLARRVRVVEDARIALAGATQSGEGVILISGTGVNAFGALGGRTARASGWGYLVGDEGSGFDIGRRAIAAALWAYDGRGPATALTDALLQAWNVSAPEALLDRVYEIPPPRDAIAALSQVVADVARDGDPVARSIYQRAGYHLALAAAAVVRRLAMPPAEATIATVGGVFRAGDLIRAPIRETLHSLLGATPALIDPLHPPAYGAVRLALAEGSASPTDSPPE
ncbi:MAG: BadF/BadG/BcrA/BcrD ATPase family protein [Anaerolineae bacterium]